MKKPPSKVAHNRPPTFFMYWHGCPNGPETEILYHQKLLNAVLGFNMKMKHKTAEVKSRTFGAKKWIPNVFDFL